jgi:hypothetical protein
MASRNISRSALQELVLQKLKAAPGCGGARSVVIQIGAGADAYSNWQVGLFDSGTSPTDACRKAIAAIETCLQGHYPAVDDL